VEQKSFKQLYTKSQMEVIYKTRESKINQDGQDGKDEAKNVLFRKYKHIYDGE